MILKQRVICGITAPMIEAELVLATGVWHEFLEDIPTERLLSTFHDAVKSAKDKREVGVVLVLRTFHQSRRAAEVEHYISASEYLNPAREADNARL